MDAETVMPRTLSERTASAAASVLAGRGGRFGFLSFAGPAVIASIAYMDPGNFATNIQAGSRYGYALLWVVVLANGVAMLFQALSARLGIVTGRSLATLCRERFPQPVVIAMWLASEVAAMATDLAEFLGAAVGLSLLFHLPLLICLAITAVATYGLLLLGNRGFRPLEIVITGFVAVIGGCYIAELMIAPPDFWPFAYHSVVPSLPDGEAVTLAVGIIGATVMPHAIYLHSSLTQNRIIAADAAQTRRILRYSDREVLIALGFAGLVNMAMIAMAAAVFHAGYPDTAEIETAYRTLVPLLGAGAGAVFLLSLLASGFSSSVVGTLAGQGIMQDFVTFRTPLWFRRGVTMLPAFVVVALGADATRSLVLSQVVLSMTLPVPMLALLLLVGDRTLLGEFRPSRPIRLTAWVAAGIVLLLNILLIVQTLG